PCRVIYTRSLHDALPIFEGEGVDVAVEGVGAGCLKGEGRARTARRGRDRARRVWHLRPVDDLPADQRMELEVAAENDPGARARHEALWRVGVIGRAHV